MYCWYKSASDVSKNVTTCMSVYSRDVGTVFGWYSSSKLNPSEKDFMQNGMFCKSGLAYNSNMNEATCVNTSGIWFQQNQLN